MVNKKNIKIKELEDEVEELKTKRIKAFNDKERTNQIMVFVCLGLFVFGVAFGLSIENTNKYSGVCDGNEAISTIVLDSVCERIAGAGYIYKDSDFLADTKLTCILNQTEEIELIEVIPKHGMVELEKADYPFHKCCYPANCPLAKENPKECDCIYPVACW